MRMRYAGQPAIKELSNRTVMNESTDKRISSFYQEILVDGSDLTLIIISKLIAAAYQDYWCMIIKSLTVSSWSTD